MTAPFVTPTICQGGDEQHELHVRYCVPLAEQLAGTRTLSASQVHSLVTEAISQYRENVDVHGQGEEQAANEAAWAVIDGLFTDLDDDPDACARCGCTDEAACPGGCFWIAHRLCSACATPKEMAALSAEPIALLPATEAGA